MEPIKDPAFGKHVAIVALGPSSRQYLEFVKKIGRRRAFADETWVINALGDVFQCDRVFHMDDVRVQEARGAAAPQSNIAEMLTWLRKHPGPIVTSRLHPDYPGLVEFPLEAVVNRFPYAYFNSTAAYAIAYAIHVGVRKMTIFGMDFTYPDAQDAEKGRACVEFWLGIAHCQGIELSMPNTTTLMDACYLPPFRFYGYDCVDLDFKRVDGRIVIGMKEHGRAIDVDAVEARYDHTQHPNPLVEEPA